MKLVSGDKKPFIAPTSILRVTRVGVFSTITSWISNLKFQIVNLDLEFDNLIVAFQPLVANTHNARFLGGRLHLFHFVRTLNQWVKDSSPTPVHQRLFFNIASSVML